MSCVSSITRLNLENIITPTKTIIKINNISNPIIQFITIHLQSKTPRNSNNKSLVLANIIWLNYKSKTKNKRWGPHTWRKNKSNLSPVLKTIIWTHWVLEIFENPMKCKRLKTVTVWVPSNLSQIYNHTEKMQSFPHYI